MPAVLDFANYCKMSRLKYANHAVNFIDPFPAVNDLVCLLMSIRQTAIPLEDRSVAGTKQTKIFTRLWLLIADFRNPLYLISGSQDKLRMRSLRVLEVH